MPLYEFYCEECGERFEKRLSFAQSDTRVLCPECQGERTRKLISAGLILGVGAPTTEQAGGCGCGGHCACHA